MSDKDFNLRNRLRKIFCAYFLIHTNQLADFRDAAKYCKAFKGLKDCNRLLFELSEPKYKQAWKKETGRSFWLHPASDYD